MIRNTKALGVKKTLVLGNEGIAGKVSISGKNIVIVLQKCYPVPGSLSTRIIIFSIKVLYYNVILLIHIQIIIVDVYINILNTQCAYIK